MENEAKLLFYGVPRTSFHMRMITQVINERQLPNLRFYEGFVRVFFFYIS
jgi:hypothetical protein